MDIRQIKSQWPSINLKSLIVFGYKGKKFIPVNFIASSLIEQPSRGMGKYFGFGVGESFENSCSHGISIHREGTMDRNNGGIKQFERITGRLTWGKVAVGGLLSGVWLGVFVGLIFWVFSTSPNVGQILATAVFGAVFGLIWAMAGYAATRGQRDFSSVSTVVATKYEVLVEHKHAATAREILGGLPGALPNPFL